MACVDLVGPLTIKIPTKAHSLLALTMIDPEIHHRLVKIVKATTKTASFIQDLFHNTWLAHYLQPQFIAFLTMTI
jgi:hypothetical protein